MTPAEDDLIRRLSWLAMRGANSSIDRDDVIQVGRMELLVAERNGRLPADPVHRRNYIAERSFGAMRTFMRRERMRSLRLLLDDEAGGALVDGGDASSYSHMTRALTEVAVALRPGGRVFIEALLAGQGLRPAMSAAGVPAWGHTQYRRRFEKLIERWL